ncbi:hypothetical protein T265_13506, partial [Opisthorchis viverrini]
THLRPATFRLLVEHFTFDYERLNRSVIGARSTVAPFWCLTAITPEGSMRAWILPSCPSPNRGSREAEVGFEPRTFHPPGIRQYFTMQKRNISYATFGANTVHADMELPQCVQHSSLSKPPFLGKTQVPHCKEKSKGGQGRDLRLASHDQSEVPTPPDIHSGNLDRK